MATQPLWMQLEHDCVCSDEAYSATEPKVDALAQPDETAGLATRIAVISKDVLSTHLHDFLPQPSTATAAKEFVDNLQLGMDRGLTFVAIPPEALELPDDAGPGDAAGLQIHIRPGDIVIPVDETGWGIAQIMFTALMDVAREANRMDATPIDRDSSVSPSPHRYATVSPPHGATGAFDPQLGVNAATAARMSAEVATSPGGRARVPEMGLIDAAWGLTEERVTDEILRFSPAPRAAPALDAALRSVLGHGPVSRAGSQFCTIKLNSSRPLMQERQRVVERAMSGGSASPLQDLRSVAAQQRAMREFASATLYSANYLRSCCLRVSDEAVSSDQQIPSDARVIFVTAGRATATVVGRIVEISTRFAAGIETLINYAGLQRIAIVALPTVPLEAQLEAAVQAADRAQTHAAAATGPGSPASAAAAAAKRGSAVASLVHGGASHETSSAAPSAAALALQETVARTYRSLARVFRAKIPRSWLTPGDSDRDWEGADFLWSHACAALCSSTA